MKAPRGLRFGMQPVSDRQDLATGIAIHEKQGEADRSLWTAVRLTKTSGVLLL
jgi:hypothetical protein